MRKLKVYLDTSVVNFLHTDDAPDYTKATEIFFNEYLDEYDVYVSDIVYLEINNTKSETKRKKLLGSLAQYNIESYDIVTEEITRLSKLYIAEKIIPEKKVADALHIAFSTYYDFDILLSWNFKHLANINKQIAINILNSKEGYRKELYLINPLEVIGEKR